MSNFIGVKLTVLLVERKLSADAGFRSDILSEADIELILARRGFPCQSLAYIDKALTVTHINLRIEIVELLSYRELNVLCYHCTKGLSFPVKVVNPKRKVFKITLRLEHCLMLRLVSPSLRVPSIFREVRGARSAIRKANFLSIFRIA